MNSYMMEDRIRAIHALTKEPMTDDHETRRVEIIILKYKEEPNVIGECMNRIVQQTVWPFKLNIFDNRPNNANTSRAWNKLVRESTCDYICIIDSDAFVPEKIEPCWLTRMMESINDTGIVVPMGDNVGGSNKATEAETYPSFETVRGVWSGFCFLFKKSALDEVGWFDEDFYIYGQDSEFAYRATKKGHPAVYRKDVFVHHMGGYSFHKAEKSGEVDREADKLYAASLYRLRTQ